jgi:hypothetical protein
MAGVPFNQLRCPTCRSRFFNEVHWDEPEPFSDGGQLEPHWTEPLPPTLLCTRGHRWTIKEVASYSNRATEVLLGQLVGGYGA